MEKAVNFLPVKELEKYFDGIRKNLAGRYGLYFNISELRPYNRHNHVLSEAMRNFAKWIGPSISPIFSLKNKDIICVVHDISPWELQKAVSKLKNFFMNDPITTLSGGQEKFYRQFNLGNQMDAFISFVTEQVALNSGKDKEAVHLQKSGKRLQIPTNTLAVKGLLEIQNTLKNADVGGFLRSQTIFWLDKPSKPNPLSQEFFLSIAALEEQLMPGINFQANPWLFKHLTLTLDRCVLQSIGDKVQRGQLKVFHLNMNVRTIVSRNFLEFHERIKGLSDQISLEVDKLDYVADPQLFSFVYSLCKELKYQLVLDGLNHYTLSLVMQREFPVDQIKIFWSVDFLSAEFEKCKDEIRKLISQIGNENIILARCDTPEAIEYGLDLGINRFQGRYLDGLAKWV